MREETLMTSAFLANFGDIFTTLYGLSIEGFHEIGPLGSSQLEHGSFSNAILFRSLVTMLLISGYALTKERNDRRLGFVFDKSLKIGNALSIGILLLNFSQIVPYLINNIFNH